MAVPRRSSAPDRIVLPTPPQERSRREFPLLATAAPVVGSLVMWAVTGSPFALVFAFLGPVVAIGSLIDDRRHGRRDARAESLRFGREVEMVLRAVDDAHQREREQLGRRALPPHATASAPMSGIEWWRHDWGQPIAVCLGAGSITSGIELEQPNVGNSPEADAAYARLRTAAGTVSDAPVFVDARDGIGIVGPAVAASALARSIVAQLALQLSPADTAISVGAGGCFDWVRLLPHPPAAHQTAPDCVGFHATAGAEGQRDTTAWCAAVTHDTELPRECRVLVRLAGAGSAVVERNPSGTPVEQLRPWLLSEAQARELAGRAAARAASDGLVVPATPLPEVIGLADLRPADPSPGRLPAAFSADATGAFLVDLVRDGPHAVVGGMTGSGKSELLVSWVLALAQTCSPTEVNFLLVDFKGGSSFTAVSALPHTVGLITDLDQHTAARALTSLRAELRHRERVIAAAGARALDELADGERMPRLVIVVDEFAVVVNDFPDLQALFADLAGRGRSLGIHLILCTQRPAGVIRDSVLANCSLRISLRVNNAADSTAVVGTSAAADLPVRSHGRCLISVGGAAPVAVQVALAGPADTERVITRHAADAPPIRRPWCEPLPPTLSLDAVVSRSQQPGIAFGLTDLPEAQSQPAAVYHPGRDGNLIVFGGLGAGKTGALAALQAAGALQSLPAVRVPADVEGAWDTITAAAEQLGRSGRQPVLYLLDDLDAVLGRFSSEYHLEFVETLARLLREGSGQGSRVVLTAARPTPGIQSLVALCDSRLILRMPSRPEHLLAGADGADYDAELPPGAGSWRGHRVQIARVSCGPTPSVSTRAEWCLHAGESLAVVTAAPSTVGQLRASAPDLVFLDLADQPDAAAGVTVVGGGRQVLVGDAASWQSRWGLFAAARRSGQVLFAGCGVQEFRTLVGSRQLPPPLGPAPGAGWLLARDGSVSRTQLPGWPQRGRTDA